MCSSDLASALSLGARMRMAKSFNAVEEAADSLVRVAEMRGMAFELGLAMPLPYRDWSAWLVEFDAVEGLLHGGSAGAADEGFYRRVRAFLQRSKAPDGVVASIGLYHGLAAWDFHEAARAGDTLISLVRRGERWLPTELLRRGTALAKVKLGDLNGAGRVYTSLSTLGGKWSLPDEVLEAYIMKNLPPDPVSSGAASAAPAPPRH